MKRSLRSLRIFAPSLCAVALAAGLAAGLAIAPAAAAEGGVEIDSHTFGGLAARAIGPAVMSGRIAAIDAVAEDPLTLYAGTASGGLWKSIDAGVTWKPVFDDHTQSIGAVALDPSDPKTVWVGTGESWVRNSVSVGDGVYKTADGGETWQRVGLETTERIARIRIHPRDGKTAWVCATGHLWNDHEERGVYKTTDGGKTWKKTLYVDAETGCSDLDVDPQDPSILYAGLWSFRRQPWTFRSGGPGSGLYKSTDGGETWSELTEGLPAGDKGRIAVAVAPSRPSVVYALVEAEKTALYRSDDTGLHWREVNASFNVAGRPFYFAYLVVDPKDFNTVYKPGFSLTVSTDGGRSFSGSFAPGGGGVHSDHHALWINPKNPHEMLLGTDGGVYVSQDQAHHWRFVKALPISQFYRVSVDMEVPYNVYGGLQDNGSWMGPSRGIAGIQNGDWRNVGYGDGFWTFRDPTDPDFVYSEHQGGKIARVRLSTGSAKDVQPLPGKGEPEYRFNWNAPIHLSPNEPGTLYLGAQYLFRSRDRGESWEKISPDLTTGDPAKQQQRKSGGLTVDNSTAENHTTIYTIGESPRNGRVIWAGTDDGNLQVTRDGGATWTNVAGNLPGLPANTWVSHVEPSPHDEATAFATFDGHATGDMAPRVYKTTDFGATWTSLAGEGIEGYAHVVRQDLENPDLLFLGTELGLWISIDGGTRWARFTGNLPKVAVRDLAIHPREGDLVIATHGRGVYILDDLTPLRGLTLQALAAGAAMLPSRPSVRTIPASIQHFPGDDEFVGENPPEAAQIAYYLKKRHVFGDLKLEVYDAQGALVATLTGGKRRGINRVDWPMRLPPPKMPPATSLVTQPFSFLGPRLPAGTYTVKLIQGQESYTSQVELVPDPRSQDSAEDRALQQETLTRLYGMLGRLTYVVDAATAAHDAARERSNGLPEKDRLRRQLTALADRLESLRASLVATSEGGWISGDEKLRENLGFLYGAVNGYEGRPTRSQLERAEVLGAELDAAAARLEAIRAGELSEANRALEQKGLEPIPVQSREAWEQEAGKQAGAPPAGWAPAFRWMLGAF